MKRSRFYYRAPYPEIKEITFDGTAGLGAVGTFDLFTVTGQVLIVALAPYCTVDIAVDGGAGVASMQLGIANATTLLIPTTTAVDIDAAKFWGGVAPDAYGVALPAELKDILITEDIKGEVTTTNAQLVNAGTLRFPLWWLPMSADGNLVAA